jgi:hypothetical protein
MLRAILSYTIALGVVIGGWFIIWDRFDRSPVPSKVLPARPAVVNEGADELGALLRNAQWVAPGLEGGVIYKIGFRQCPDCINFEKSVFPALHERQIDTRVIMYKRASGRYESSDAEQRALDTLYRERDWTFFESWMEDANPTFFYENTDMAPVEGDADAQARIQAAVDTHDQVAEIMAANGWSMERPAMFWQDEGGRWRVIMGDTPRIQRKVLKAFDAN